MASVYPPEIADLAEELFADVQNVKKSLANENHDWIDETYDINFWEFMKNNFHIVCWFQILMDNSKWDYLASGLGLNNDEIEWIRTYHKQGPTREVFCRLAFKGELKSLSLGDVLNELRKLKQMAILSRVTWQKGIDNFRKGFDVTPSITAKAKAFTLDIHQAPEILVNSANVGEVADKQLKIESKRTIKPSKSKFALKIIMFFASDAREEALRAAGQLKISQDGQRDVGVMIITRPDHQGIVNALLQDPCNSIHKWYKQVDYVVPVLSPQFLRQIQDRDSDPNTIEERQYNRYLYRLTLDEYVANMSKNIKCRALYDPEYCTQVRNSDLVKGNGLFQMNWDCSSDEQLEQFRDILIAGTKR